ncbi:MAG TPA: deoxyribonuclease IV [candidate division Zixibacteria bacterium]|nr:deoxyribonuclease IV [candidate division Zixibacteria bacterium]
MARTVARRESRRRLRWPADAPRVGIHLGVGQGLLKAARRAREIGATALQIFSDNPTAWRRRPEPPRDAPQFVAYCRAHGIAPISIHASYLVNLAGRVEPFASQSRQLLIHELRTAPAFGAYLVNTHIGSHRGTGHQAGLRRIVEGVHAILAETPRETTLVLENSAGGGDNIGSTIEELAEILEGVAATSTASAQRLAFCLDTAHLWGAGHDISTAEGATGVIDRFAELIGLDRLRLVHLNDSRSELGSRTDRHEHVAGGRIGPEGMRALLTDPRLCAGTAFMLETPGVDEGYDAINMRRTWLLYHGQPLPALPARAFTLHRRSTRVGPGLGRRTVSGG